MSLVLKVFVHEGGRLPQKGKPGDAGLDVFACLPNGPLVVSQFESAKIPLGFSYSFAERTEMWGCLVEGADGPAFVDHVPAGTLLNACLEGYWLDVRNRSGVGMKSGFVTIAEVGDSNYRGVLHYCVAKVTPGTYTINHGDKIAQVLIHPFVVPHTIEILQVHSIEELGVSDRGAQGFGASGT